MVASKCPECGGELAAGLDACPACGNPVAAASAVAAKDASLGVKAQQFLLVQLCCLGLVFILAGSGAGVWGVVLFLAAAFGFPLVRLAALRQRN